MSYNDNERLIDLVRYCRTYLHDEGLITDDEPCDTCGGSRRLVSLPEPA